jgi:hypothetical protein
LLPSIELAREELHGQGPRLDEKTVHRMACHLGAEVLTTRTRDLQRFRAGLLPAGQELAGHHVVAQLDGGRVRIRTQIQTKKRKGVKYRRKIRVEWREPKLLILYTGDGKGRMLRGTRPWIDGTMKGPDHLMELLALHLHHLGAARAKSITFVSDGACWIWNRLDWVIARAGLDPKRIERVLDFYHAVHHVSLALQSLGLSEGRVAEGPSSFRLRLTSVSGFPRVWLNIRWPCDDDRLRPLQTGRADFPHPASPNPSVSGMHREWTRSRPQ